MPSQQFKTLLVLILLWLFVPHGADAAPFRIGVVIDGPWRSNPQILNLFRQEILDLTTGEFDVRFPEDRIIESDWSVNGVRRAVDGLLADDTIDLLLTIGVLGSHEVCQRRDLPKPVVAPIIIDSVVQRLPNVNGTSGIENLSYIVFPNNILADIKEFLNIVPFKKVAVLLNQRVIEAIPAMATRVDSLLQTVNVETVVFPVDQSVDEVLALFPADVDAVYIAPLIHLPDGEFDQLIASLIERKLPSYSMMGRRDVEAGILASTSADVFPRLARRVALNVQSILLGDSPGSLPTAFPAREELTINMATARAIGKYPGWGVITEAQLINERRQGISRHVTIQSAVSEALEMNLELAVRAQSIAASEQEIKLARANLLPQIDLSLLGSQIDKDRAETSLGQQAERTLSGGITLEQILYAEPAWANLAVEKHLQEVREYERDILKLDIAQAAATAYLNVLRAKTFETIQKENLERTRSNLELARIRETIGTARPAEVFRWESQLANNRKEVIESSSLRNVAEIALNRLLHRPAEEHFNTDEVDINDPQLLLSRSRLAPYIGNPWSFKIFRSFMVTEGVESTPEILALREAIAAQDRVHASASRSFWLPSLGLRADLDNVFSKDGAGSSVPPNLSMLISEPKDLSWSVGVSLNYSLLSGGAKIAERRRATHALSELRIQLENTSELIEQRIRSAIHATGASYAGIRQARLAAEASGKSLNLVEDAYSRGTATILDLLDAQNNALVAREQAADAVYDFLIDLMEMERSVGKLIFQVPAEEREAFFERLQAYFDENEQP